MSDDRHDAVSRRAYELWEREGGGHGRHEEHWHQAARELGGGEGAPAADDAATAPAADDAATADEAAAAAVPAAETVAPDGTTMTDAAATAAEAVRPTRKRTPAKPKSEAPARPRKSK